MRPRTFSGQQTSGYIPWLPLTRAAGQMGYCNYACDYGFSAVDQYQCRGNDAATGNVFPYFGVGLAMLFGDSDWHHKNLSFGE